jgi:hypothetical protein
MEVAALCPLLDKSLKSIRRRRALNIQFSIENIQCLGDWLGNGK